jgi:hypothetical protein
MYAMLEYFQEATIGEFVLGVIVGALVIRLVWSILFG